MLQSALGTPTSPVWVAHIAAHSSRLFMSTDLSWEKNLDEQGIEVLPCLLLGWTTGVLGSLLLQQTGEILRMQFSKALQWPPRVSVPESSLFYLQS